MYPTKLFYLDVSIVATECYVKLASFFPATLFRAVFPPVAVFHRMPVFDGFRVLEVRVVLIMQQLFRITMFFFFVLW